MGLFSVISQNHRFLRTTPRVSMRPAPAPTSAFVTLEAETFGRRCEID